MIAIAGTIAIPPDKRDACLAATVAYQEATRRDEPGCLAYVFGSDACDPGTIRVFELWADAESLEAHFLHANYFDMRRTLGEQGITGADVKKYLVAKEAPVYGPDRVATASFEGA